MQMGRIFFQVRLLLVTALLSASSFAAQVDLPPLPTGQSTQAIQSTTQSIQSKQPGTNSAPVPPPKPVPIAPPPPHTLAVSGEPRVNTTVITTEAAHDEIKANEFNTFGTPEDPAFQNMIKKMFPMSPEQIHALKETQSTTQRAIAAPPEPPPRAVVSTAVVSLAPGSVPPVVRLASGYVSSVVFVDETGAPWPIGAYNIGDPTKFNIQWNADNNILMIQGQGAYATGNMAVTLRDSTTPVMLTLVNDQKVVDYRLDLRVQGRGPHAKASIIGSVLPQNSNVVLMNLLDGVAPRDAQQLGVEGGPAEVWLNGQTMYVRTPLTLLSPAWLASLSSADGTHVYQMIPTPMILVSDRGVSTTLQIKGL